MLISVNTDILIDKSLILYPFYDSRAGKVFDD